MVEQCSAQSWKKASAWGDSDAACRDQVARHLMHSGHHRLSKADATSMANLALVEAYEDDSDNLPPAKRQAIGAKQQPSSGSASASAPAIAPPEAILSPTSTSVGIVPAVSSGFIFMRVHEFQAAIDSVNRAAHAAAQAQRLALAAGRAFADEVTALQEVKANLEAIKATAEMNSYS